MNKKIIVQINFNNIKYSDLRLSKEWIEERLNIFWRYTLQSLKAQTNQAFEVYLNYDILSKAIIQESLAKREPLPSNIHFGDTKFNNRAIDQAIIESDIFYWVRLDSDNLYHKEYIQKLYDYTPQEGTEALVSQYGYLYGEFSDRLARYYQLSPPFYTLIYQPQEYINGKRYVTPGGHRSVCTVLKYEVIPGYNYLVSIHSQNTSNGEWMINRNNKIIIGKERKEILTDFGLSKLTS